MFTTELCQLAIELIQGSKPFAVATVVRSAGSTPQKAGAAALIEPNGRIHGTLGGGCLEAECRQRALRSLDLGSPMVFDLKLDEVEGWDDGLICGGRVRVLINPDPSGNLAACQRLLEAGRQDRPGYWVTTVQHPERSIGRSEFYLENELIEMADWDPSKSPVNLMEFEAPKLVQSEEGRAEYFVESFLPSPKLLIAGAGHIGKATSHFGRLLGFHVTVVDDRTSFANAENLPDAHNVICGDIAGEVGSHPIDENTFIVIVTRGHRHDGKVLAACVHSKARFIGMIGSRRKSLLIRKSLVGEGIATEAEVNRVVSPIGLEIGSLTVNEIALSIASQLVSFRRRGSLEASARNYLKNDQRHHHRGGSLQENGQPQATASL
jgi:xanthine dehydrogenase accessory factor